MYLSSVELKDCNLLQKYLPVAGLRVDAGCQQMESRDSQKSDLNSSEWQFVKSGLLDEVVVTLTEIN